MIDRREYLLIRSLWVQRYTGIKKENEGELREITTFK
jgi:hypothetical protein